MSEFFRMPNSWHEELNKSMPELTNIEFMTGTKLSRLALRLSRELDKGIVQIKQFCHTEGVKYNTFEMALMTFDDLWEDGGHVGRA